MKFDRSRFTATAKATGFQADNLEKVLRLRKLLNEFQKHSFLRGKLVLKGGTALNLSLLFCLASVKITQRTGPPNAIALIRARNGSTLHKS